MQEAYQTITLAVTLGAACHLISRQFRIPAILFYLLAGIIFGPLGLGLLLPQSMGYGLMILVEVGVAIILFEGGLSLSLRSFQKAPAAILNVLLLSIPITAVGGALLSHYLLGLSWDMAVLFGTIIVISGPTVIAPLLKSVELKHRLETMLHWESIWGDVAGVLLSALALEFLLLGQMGSIPGLLGIFLLTILDGMLIGLLGGMLLQHLLLPWASRLEARELPGVIAFAAALAIFYTSHQIMLSSGPLAVVVAGFYISRNKRSGNRFFSDILHFKDQLSVLFIGTLFVLLSAYTNPLQVQEHWLLILATVLAVQFLLRPLAVKFCLLGVCPDSKERWFMGLIGPKGIVALATAAYAALGVSGREQEVSLLLNTIFVLILSTGAFTSLFGRPLARMLGVLNPPSKSGILLVGHNPLSLGIASFAQKYVHIAFLDTSPRVCAMLQENELNNICTHILDDNIYDQATEEGFKRMLVLTKDDPLNQLICQTAAQHLGEKNVYAVQGSEQGQAIRVESLYQVQTAFSPELILNKVLPLIQEAKTSFQLLDPEQASQEHIFPLLEVTRDQGLRICTPQSRPQGQVFCLVLPAASQ
ncbi:MAG: cation:proton antiporter [Desulfohalobiaceae bacterium]